MLTKDKITEILKQDFTPTSLEVIDESHKHAGHKGSQGGGHFILKIASPLFKDKTLVQCHQLVYQALGELMTTEIHALQIRIL